MSNESKTKYPTCHRCGRSNVSADAAARWDHQTQDWTITNVFDKGHSCDDCEDECRIEWKEGTPQDLPVGFPSIEETETALLLVNDTNVDKNEIQKWTDQQRTLAFDWAMAVHFSASDNDDVVVPARPDFIPHRKLNDEQ